VGIKTGGEKTILDGGIFQDEVALHFAVGQAAKESESISTVSTAIAQLRKILVENKGKESIYGKAANGSIPLIVHVENKYDIEQLIKLKTDIGDVNLVIQGGSGAPAVADALARVQIPIILTHPRGAPDAWEKLDTLVGPPLTRSPTAVLVEAGVRTGLAFEGFSDPHLHGLALEASWAAKYAGLSERAAVDLVSRNIEQILGLGIDEERRDFVVYEGDPLEFGASVVVAVDGEDGEVRDCWPESE